jgi:endonuclease III
MYLIGAYIVVVVGSTHCSRTYRVDGSIVDTHLKSKGNPDDMARAPPSTRSAAPASRSSKRRKTEEAVVKNEDVSNSTSNGVKEEESETKPKVKAEQGGEANRVKAEPEVKPGAEEEPSAEVNPKMEEMRGVRPKVEDEVKPGVGEATIQANGDENEVEEDRAPAASRPTRRSTRSKRSAKLEAEDEVDELDDAIGELVENTPSGRSTGSAAESKPKTAPKNKNKYNLTPGQTPFPDYPHPTREECQNVIDLLSTVHEKPERTMLPSVTVPGCGEVPAVLDSLMRTMLSAATTTANSSRAFKNIVEKYGLLTEGIGKGSVDWDKVRLGTQQDLFKAIQCGGLAQNKSKNIKAVLDMVYEENQERREAILAAKKETPKETAGEPSQLPPGVKRETSQELSDEIYTADANVLSLNYLHALSTDEAMSKLTSYPGVGVKTASCVILFNFGRGSFAVDTHVWRLCRWLGWVPGYATRNQTYSHCDMRIPDEMKYDLHGLFWKHGKYW